MGNLISQAANGIGTVVGNAFFAPFKSVFGATCEEVCAGPWDVVCFIEHLCVANLAKFVLIVGLCYMILLFFFLLFKLGLCQCIGKSLCKMCWVASVSYWYAIGDVSCFLWRRLTRTKRVYRGQHRRYQDLEVGNYSSTDEEVDSPRSYNHLNASKKRKSLGGSGEFLSLSDPSSRHGRHNGRSHKHHHVKLRKKPVSLRINRGSGRLRSSRNYGRTTGSRHGRRHHHYLRESKSFKRQKLG